VVVTVVVVFVVVALVLVVLVAVTLVVVAVLVSLVVVAVVVSVVVVALVTLVAVVVVVVVVGAKVVSNEVSYKSDTKIVFRQGLHPTPSIETSKGNDCIPVTGWPSKLTDKMPPLRLSWIVWYWLVSNVVAPAKEALPNVPPSVKKVPPAPSRPTCCIVLPDQRTKVSAVPATLSALNLETIVKSDRPYAMLHFM